MASHNSCSHGNSAPAEEINNLKDSQAGTGRHKCAICAYRNGYKAAVKNVTDFGRTEMCAHKNIAPYEMLKNLPENQGGIGRHKCVICAFQHGYRAGSIFIPHEHNLIKTNLQYEKNKYASPGILQVPVHIPATLKPKKEKETFSETASLRTYNDEKNKELGLAGELLVLKHEIEFLVSSDREDLAEKVQHTSIEVGDGVGYDIRSFSLDGSEKHIEVKTTTSNMLTPFFITQNELDFANSNTTSYHLYRVYEYNKETGDGKVFILTGELGAALYLKPILFKVEIQQ